MKHQNRKGGRFGREKEVRSAMFSAMAASLIVHGRVRTTESKAKELARIVEPMVTRAKQEPVYARRLLARKLPPKAVKHLVDEVAPRFKERPGGYTRITQLAPRTTDGARMAIIEFVS